MRFFTPPTIVPFAHCFPGMRSMLFLHLAPHDDPFTETGELECDSTVVVKLEPISVPSPPASAVSPKLCDSDSAPAFVHYIASNPCFWIRTHPQPSTWETHLAFPKLTCLSSHSTLDTGAVITPRMDAWVDGQLIVQCDLHLAFDIYRDQLFSFVSQFSQRFNDDGFTVRDDGSKCRDLLAASHPLSAWPHNLTKIFSRWQETTVLLAPAVEMLPQLMFLPVVVFIPGLSDNLYSSSLGSHPVPILFYQIFPFITVIKENNATWGTSQG
ncbi:hypothetical protein C8R44DRAFT_977459 [Mycena epipterygia]|nr:hypothetical protein C8R44DRAFT_977459 [Mycena epipterygia]